MRSLVKMSLILLLGATAWVTTPAFAQLERILSAIKTGDVATVREVLDQSADIVRFSNNGRTLLHHAAIHNQSAIARLLIDRGADVNAKDNVHIIEGTTPLHFAANLNAAELAKVLLAAGANVRTTDRLNHTPLHNAAFEGSSEVAELLIEKGADVNATGRSGLTPLHWAAHQSKPQTARVLLRHGAHPGSKDSQGKTPLDSAAAGGSSEVALLLLDHGADPCWLRGKRASSFDAEDAAAVIKMVVAKCATAR